MDNDQQPILQKEDFSNALDEIGSYSDISVDNLMDIQTIAQKYARQRRSEEVSIGSIMKQSVITVTPDCSLSDAAHILVEQRISGLPVVDHTQVLVGIITEADFLRALGIPSHYPGHSLWQTLENWFSHSAPLHEPEGTVEELMMHKVFTVTPDHSLHQALTIMKQNHIKRLVVTDEQHQVIGMVTRSDLIRLFFDRFQSVKQKHCGE